MPVRTSSSVLWTRERARVFSAAGLLATVAVLATACGNDEPATADESLSSDPSGASASDLPGAGASGPSFVARDGGSTAKSCDANALDLEGCPCGAGQTHACYTGPLGTRNLGACHDGIQSCVSGGEFGATFGPCAGQALPKNTTECAAGATLDTDAGGHPWDGLSGKPCTFDGKSIPPMGKVTAYQSATVAYGDTCRAEERQCQDGELTGSFDSPACAVATASTCVFAGQAVPDGGVVTAYSSPSVPYGQSCAPLASQRTCNNGSLSGSGDYASCAVATAATCTLDGQTIASGASVSAYAVANGYCQATTRYCYNGVLNGTGDYASCTPAASSVGQPCTPDSAVTVSSSASAITGCSSGWSFAGNSANSLYCDGSAKWQCFLAGNCEPTSCTSCLQTHCADKVASVSPACAAGLRRAFNWLSTCGPDRPAYFQSFGSACTANELQQLNSCKFQYCYAGGGMGLCNGY